MKCVLLNIAFSLLKAENGKGFKKKISNEFCGALYMIIEDLLQKFRRSKCLQDVVGQEFAISVTPSLVGDLLIKLEGSDFNKITHNALFGPIPFKEVRKLNIFLLFQ